MKAFEFAAPETEAELVEFLSDVPGKTELLAGGTDLVGLMKKMIVTPDRVVNIMDVATLKIIEPQSDGGLVIGAAVTLDELLDAECLGAFPAVEQAIRGINSMQLQAQGTLVGELCQRPRCWFFRNGQGGLLAEQGKLVAEGDNRYHAIFGNQGPAKFVSSSRIAPGLISLGAQLRVLGPDQQEQLVPLADFYRTPRTPDQRETILAPNQVVTHVLIPPSQGRLNATYEVRHGEGPDYPLAAASVSMEVVAGLVRSARVVLGQVAPTPWVSLPATVALEGSLLGPDAAHQAGQAAAREATPLSENQYKVQLAQVAVKRAVLRAAGLETGGF